MNATIQPDETTAAADPLGRADDARRRRRLAVGLALAVAVAGLGYLGREVGSHLFAAVGLGANSIQVTWQVDGETWRRGGVTAVKAYDSPLGSAATRGHGELWALSRLHRVEALDLSLLVGLKDSELESLGELTDLEALNLGQARENYRAPANQDRPTDATLARLGRMSRLRDLSLAKHRITDAGLLAIAGLDRLETLDLRDTGVTDAGLATLARLKGLKTLTLTGTKVTPGGLQGFRAARPDVEVVADPPAPAPR